MCGLLIFRLIAAVVCLGTARGLLYPRESGEQGGEGAGRALAVQSRLLA